MAGPLDGVRIIDVSEVISGPLAVMLLAEQDEVIPRASSEKLIAAFQSPLVTKVVIHQANHNSIGMMASYRTALDSFLREETAAISVANGESRHE